MINHPRKRQGFLFCRQMDNTGRICLPKDIRQALGWQKGDTLLIAAQENGLFIRRVSPEDALLTD